ncbi:hypothetical protein C2857_006542 [Epichloe festucae Fl1]|uniref:Uncharacterized protein n=1 Tax=Epichloe festucae (strain Fl1) TaxID=877507 RepID=A0A7S9KTK3_EPIFF|nr:hypothetical protein C2857_006542 [Epichloe festucae Fl1]
MSKTNHTLENGRLEIILLAAAVLVLVSLLAVLILVCVSLKQSHRPPISRHATAWGGSWSERWDAGPLEPYRDDENLFDRVRQRSTSIAEDAKRELTSLEKLVPLAIPNRDNVTDQRAADDSFSNTAGISREAGNQALEYTIDSDESDSGDLESPASSTSTARDQKVGTVTRRSERAVIHNDSCDLEAQSSEDSDP